MTELVHKEGIKKPLEDDIKNVFYKYFPDKDIPTEQIDDIMAVFSERFKLTSIELNTMCGIKITSDNTNKNTCVTAVGCEKNISAISLKWELDINKIGEFGILTLEYY